MVAYKRHYVVGLRQDWERTITPVQKRNITKAEHVCKVELCIRANDHLDDWVGLYDCLIQQHHTTRIAAFFRESVMGQCGVPGLVVCRHGRIVSPTVVDQRERQTGYMGRESSVIVPKLMWSTEKDMTMCIVWWGSCGKIAKCVNRTSAR